MTCIIQILTFSYLFLKIFRQLFKDFCIDDVTCIAHHIVIDLVIESPKSCISILRKEKTCMFAYECNRAIQYEPQWLN